MIGKKKIKLQKFVASYSTTNVVVPMELPQDEFKRKMSELRSWAMKNMKETLMILITYSLWAIIFSYSYSHSGYSGLGISIGVAVLYKLDRLVNKQ